MFRKSASRIRTSDPVSLLILTNVLNTDLDFLEDVPESHGVAETDALSNPTYLPLEILKPS